MTRPPRWAVITFAVALAARVAFVFLADQPLLYTHQYHYFTNALRLALHPHPLEYVVFHDDWRTWNGHWTIAPLYHLFAGAALRAFHLDLLPLRLLQCALDALAAVGVAWLGRRAAGPRGHWAGLAYAVYWPAVEMPTWTMTENLHTVLLVGGIALLVRATERGRARGYVAAGVVLGLGALTRSVTAGFIVLAGSLLAWRALAAARRRGLPVWRAALVPLAALGLGSAAVVLPWTARNVFILHEPVLIETAAFENIWFANNFGDAAQFARQQEVVHGQPTPAAQRAAALHFALRGIRRHPERLAEKARVMFWHFLRPEGLHGLLLAERAQEPWRDVGTLLLDDLLLLAMLPPLVAYLAAGRPGTGRAVTTLWIAYYLLMVVVVFHNEIRYRSAFVPFGFAGAAGGLAVLGDRARGARARVALGLGLLLVAAILWPYGAPALRALAARPAIRAAASAAAQGDVERAFAQTERAAARDARSARPWMDLGRALARSDHPLAALAAYERALPLASPANWRATVARPWLLATAGRVDEATEAQEAAHRLSWDSDPWLVLEVAWRELPPPRTDVIVVGGQDYGAARGFLHPRLQGVEGTHRGEFNQYDDPAAPAPPAGRHRWTRHRAWLRLRPTQAAAAYDVTLFMGAPFPCPLESPLVTVWVSGAPPQRVRLGPALAAYTLRAAPAAGQPIEVEIEAPTWNRIGEPAEQGVRVDRLEVRPARG